MSVPLNPLLGTYVKAPLAFTVSDPCGAFVMVIADTLPLVSARIPGAATVSVVFTGVTYRSAMAIVSVPATLAIA